MAIQFETLSTHDKIWKTYLPSFLSSVVVVAVVVVVVVVVLVVVVCVIAVAAAVVVGHSYYRISVDKVYPVNSTESD